MRPHDTDNSPAPAVCLAGTPEGLTELRGVLACAPEAVSGSASPIGAVLIDPAATHAPRVAGLPVLDRDDAIARASVVLCCCSSEHGPAVDDLRRACDAAGVPLRVIEPLAERLGASEPSRFRSPVRVGGAHTAPTQTFDPGVLLGRTPRPVEHSSVRAALGGKRVLVTGAGGSIGSELCRQIAAHDPEALVLMERSENALFEIDRQIARLFPRLPRHAVLHDVVDERGTTAMLARLRPHAVYHAAAHKHVPLMEDHPHHAVRNNFFGTRSIASAADACGAERFVLISSDKAVNPSSVMGATKRLAERFVQALAPASDVRMSMVRFGNVLGSAGSVVPVWTAQMAEGGPLTVTDERMTRFFMTIPEAAQLVLQASVLPEPAGGGAAVYELDMGAPVRILDLALRFAELHGCRPRIVRPGEPAAPARPGGIDVVLTGVRPGEKLHEELAYQAEQVVETECPGVRRWSGDAPIAERDLAAMVEDFARVCEAADDALGPEAAAGVLETIRRWVPEMRPAEPEAAVRHAPVAAA